jgi:predicted DNA-binding transcriptional regulator YafY
VRRYVMMLRDMGIPVESEKGRYGSYSLRPGFRLPPLMFTDPEILAIVLGLIAVRQMGLAATPGVESALSKIARVLPDELAERARAVESTLTLNVSAATPVAAEMLARFSIAAHGHSRLWIEYAGSGGERTAREIDVYGLIFHAGAWYAVAHCHLRNGLRVFRLDRVAHSRVLPARFDPPADFDALAYLLNSIATMPGVWNVEVLFEGTPFGNLQRAYREIGMLEATANGVRLRCFASDLDWIARTLLARPYDFTVIQPPELRDALREIASAILKRNERPVGKRRRVSRTASPH